MDAIGTKRCYGYPKSGIPGHDNVLFSEFGKNKTRKFGLNAVCKTCCALYIRTPKQRLTRNIAAARILATPEGKLSANVATVRYRHSPKGKVQQLVSDAKLRAKDNELPFDLDGHIQDIIDIIIRGICQETGLPFDIEATGGPAWNSPSIDQINAGSGYLWSNVRIVLYSVNTLFGTWGREKGLEVARALVAKDDERKTVVAAISA
jgi:hypothetical protein